jgi:hypothetical protein
MHQVIRPCLQGLLQVRQQVLCRQLQLLAGLCCCSCWLCLPVGVPGQPAACSPTTALGKQCTRAIFGQQGSSSTCMEAVVLLLVPWRRCAYMHSKHACSTQAFEQVQLPFTPLPSHSHLLSNPCSHPSSKPLHNQSPHRKVGVAQRLLAAEPRVRVPRDELCDEVDGLRAG